MTPTQARLLAAERRYVTLDARVRKLRQGVTALQQNVRDSDGLGGALGCVRTWALTVTGNAGLPLPGVPIAYGPFPYDPLTAAVVGTTDGSGLLTVTTVDPQPVGNPHFYVTGPRFDPVADGGYPAGLSAGACGGTAAITVSASAAAAGYKFATTFPTPWPIDNNLVTTISSLGLTALSLTNVYGGTANFNGWGTASVRPPVNTASYVITANYPGGGAPGCAANAALSLVISLLDDGSNPAALIFEYHEKGGGGAQTHCPFAGSPYGAGGASLQYDVPGGSTFAITGDGNLATGLTLTMTPPAASPILFPAGSPTFVLTEV